MEVLQNIDVFIDEKEVLRYQGYQVDVTKLKPAIKELLKLGIEEGYRLVQPKAAVDFFKIATVGEGSITMDGGLALDIKDKAQKWEGSAYLAVSVSTIGPALEERVSQLFADGEYANGGMLDSVGTVAARSVADWARNFICKRAAGLDMQAGTRISPGGKIDLTYQKTIFSLIDAEEIGVRLTSHCMMVPQKSVSFCLGIGKDVSTKTLHHSCQRCSLTSCLYRKLD